ncbi:MAG: CBS domain-containing protein [Verrucomicrobia bacterium]|nr:CBS domain-containing protein [Verrucomicrobiota bacterium]
MKKREAVSKIMQRELKTMSIHDGNLKNAKTMMEENNIRHLPIVSGEKLVGIISLTDIHRISFGGNYGQAASVDASVYDTLSLEHVMMSEPRTVTVDTTIKEVAEKLAVEEFHALPVVGNDNKLEGIVTTTDLVNYLIEQY